MSDPIKKPDIDTEPVWKGVYLSALAPEIDLAERRRRRGLSSWPAKLWRKNVEAAARIFLDPRENKAA